MRSQPVCERVLTKKCNQADFRQGKKWVFKIWLSQFSWSELLICQVTQYGTDASF